MKKMFTVLIMMVSMSSCKSVATKNAVEEKEASTKSDINDFINYFTAAGNEPFWDLKMGKSETIFASLKEGSEKMVFKSVEPIRAMDANIKMYRLSNSTSKATVTITQSECEDTMSGIVSPYKVVVEITNKNGEKEKPLEGCGKYITDYRLHDIWVLEELNGKKVGVLDFQKELPRIEINVRENKFYGFGGCNSINGSIFYEKNVLRLTNAVSTLRACISGNKEADFVKALQSTTTYSIGNNRLSLSNPSGLFLVFRKVD